MTEPKRPTPAKKPIGTIGTIALAIGAGVLTVYMLDLHSHRCESCNYKWMHLGAFSLGSASAHSCTKCGTVQWWKDGVPHVFRSVLREPPPKVLPDTLVSRLQELRDAPRVALASATDLAWPREGSR